MNETLFYVAAAPFEAACRVENALGQSPLSAGHPARRLHGHSFLAKVRTLNTGANADLRQQLADCVAPLDYNDLNQFLPMPTDENLARWIRARLALPSVASVGVQSTLHQGADLDLADNAHIWRRFRFEAAHRLPNVAPGHQCGRMHGHGFEVILHANQNLQAQDMGVDFDRLEAVWQPLHEQLHHHCLNDIPGLENPTSEMLAAWLWERLKPELDALSWVSVYETVTAGCHYDGQHYRIWKDQRFESALTLTRAAPNDSVRRLHGHSYLLRLHLTAPLDTVMGWTVDYGDVKSQFKPIYQQLDHHNLNELPGLDEPDAASIARWIRSQAEPGLPQLDRIDLYETPGCGVVLSWGAHEPGLPV
ncbi:6-carboxytetrahydropterin synthase [Thiothrix lacustris]|jgi:6-pyruvoyltetrahydropterin/6-carboxytetrahydropterin synthase|uniref:6-carboxy-5,6,7,8-tetrahydropterin synthase n=1 Tax=Thiothrix lacustris TaxID=525917 RepID=A0ABY9MNU3_9GAMM|nr:6-carboxytetrahydropterin synthase [Thiothrix lacustris]WML90213.1 6-carboxytetrahydropterin synthase [Thiothrix lacustris]